MRKKKKKKYNFAQKEYEININWHGSGNSSSSKKASNQLSQCMYRNSTVPTADKQLVDVLGALTYAEQSSLPGYEIQKCQF